MCDSRIDLSIACFVEPDLRGKGSVLTSSHRRRDGEGLTCRTHVRIRALTSSFLQKGLYAEWRLHHPPGPGCTAQEEKKKFISEVVVSSSEQSSADVDRDE